MKKQDKIVEMFDNIAPTYDKANHVLSFGMDKLWRKNACKIALEKILQNEINIVDVACGTGDMMEIWDRISKEKGVNARLIGIDPSSGMLSVAKAKFSEFEFVLALADEIPLNDEFADILSISYGIRNVVEREKALNEFNRVLKNGGYLVVLEFTKRQKGGFIQFCRDFYIAKILPLIGGIISKNRQAYEYLPNSIGNFLDKNSFEEELKKAGFRLEIAKNFSFEVCTLFIAKKVNS